MNIRTTAYWAGFIDGEGNIGIYSHGRIGPRRMRTPYYVVRVSVCSTDKKIIQEGHRLFGGSISHIEEHNKRHKNVWRFEIDGWQAITVLRVILPFLKIKKAQAELCIEFWERRTKYQGKNPLPDKERALREIYHRKTLKLNKRGKGGK